MILNIHGYASNGNNSEFAWLSSHCRGHEIISPTNDYDRVPPEQIVRDLLTKLEDADAATTYIVGMSLGAFFAARLHAEHPDIMTILINPCLMPFVTMRQFDVPDAARMMYFDALRPTYERFAGGERDERLHVIYGDADDVIPHEHLTLPLLPSGAHTYKIRGAVHRMPIDGAFAATLKEIIQDI